VATLLTVAASAKGAARVLLTVIERNPAAIMDALRGLRQRRNNETASG